MLIPKMNPSTPSPSLKTINSSFGSVMIGREFEADTAGRYRFGFNGKEKINEIYGDGNGIAFGARIYDSRLGRFLSSDKYVELSLKESPYHFSGNNPILYIDKKGNFKLPPEQQKAYPVLTNELTKLYDVVLEDPNLKTQLMEYGNFKTEAELQSVLGWDQGSTLRINDKGLPTEETGRKQLDISKVFGVTELDKKGEATTSISEKFIKEVEGLYDKSQDQSLSQKQRNKAEKKLRKELKSLAQTILHETTHQGDAKDPGKDKKGNFFFKSLTKSGKKSMETGNDFDEKAKVTDKQAEKLTPKPN